MFKIKTHHKEEQGRIFAWMALISSIGFSSFITILAVTLSHQLKDDVKVGYFFAFIATISLLASLFSTVLLRRYSKITVAKWTLTLSVVTFYLFTIAGNIWHYLIFDTIRAICVTLFLIVLAIFVRDFAKSREIALAEGRYYFFTNIGWLIGPVAGGLLAENLGKESAFIFSGVSYLATLILFLHQEFIAKNPHIHDRKEQFTLKEFGKNLAFFIKDKKRIKSFFIGFGLYFWWAIYKIYIPITIINIGFHQDAVGLVVSAGMVPLILLEMLVAKKAQKNGVKKLMTFGFFWLALIVATFVWIKIPIFLLVLMVLVNIGAAFVEPLHETYFFQITEKKDEDRLYGIYNTGFPLANILAPLVGSLILSFTDINGLWIFAAGIFFILGFLSLRIKKKMP